jgi:DNA-binding CsgD family transcriptional regulator
MRTSAEDRARSLTPEPVLFGRDSELARLVAAGRGDSGRFVLVEGEGGIGKTSLLAEVMSRAEGRTVLHAAADSSDRERTLGLIREALAPLIGADERPLAPWQNEHAVAERLLSLIDTVATRPTVLVLEDLHWADAASLRLLARLSRTLAQIPLVIYGSRRTQSRQAILPELDHLLDALGGKGLLVSLELGPLTPAACIQLTEHLLGGRVDQNLERLISTAGGNPLFVTSMMRSLIHGGDVAVDSRGDAIVRSLPGPSASLSTVMMRHLSPLSAPTRELLTWGALLGTRFSITHLRLIADAPMAALAPHLQEAFAAGFLEDAGDDMLAFRHQLIQEVLQHDLPAPVRRELHRDIALRLELARMAPDTVASHLLQAPTSAEDFPWMLRLAQATATSAPGIATQLWETVLAQTAPGDLLNIRAIAGLARAALSAGHAERASILTQRALGHDMPPELLAVVSTTRTHALMQLHRNAAAGDEAELYAVSTVLEAGDRAAHLAFAGWPRFMLGDLTGAVRLAKEGRSMAAHVGNHGAEVLALALLGQIADVRGDLDEAVALLTRATDIADRHPAFASIESFPHTMLALALTDAGRLEDVRPLLRRSVMIAEEFGYRTGVLAAHAFGAQVLGHIGTLPDIWAELEAHHSMVGSMDVRMSGPVLGLRAWVAANRSGPDAAREWARRLDPVPERAAWAGRGRSWIWFGLSRLQRRVGRDEGDALAVLSEGWRELRDADMLMDCAELALELVDVARTVADAQPHARRMALERAHEVVDLCAELAGRNPGATHLTATALAVRGRATASPGPLIEATRMLSTTPRRLAHARIGELAAKAMSDGSRERRVLAESALTSYAAVGADHEVMRARAALRHAGIRLRTTAGARPSSGWGSLTRTEERVAGLVATGATNPEIAQSLSVSRRTIETHVSNVLGKLQLRSRTELALLVARHSDGAGRV